MHNVWTSLRDLYVYVCMYMMKGVYTKWYLLQIRDACVYIKAIRLI